jgi:hypothetical protein
MKKMCSKCKVEKEETCFFRNKSTSDGRSYWCQVCFRAYTQSEVARAKAKVYRQSATYLKKAREYRKSEKYASWYAAFKKTDKYRARCRTVSPALRARRNTSKFKAAAAQAHYRRTYGIAVEDKVRLVLAQGGVCASCGSGFTGGKDTTVDHDHRTSKIRGILCRKCNLALGLLMEDPVRIHQLAEYIRAGGYNYETKNINK